MSNGEQSLPAMEPDKVEQVVRELIRHENDLVNQRLTWLIQAEGLLFTALAFAWEKSPKLTGLLSFLGIATALSIGTAISMYSPAVRRLARLVPEDRKGFIMGRHAESRGLGKILRPWRALPFIFICAWLGVLALKFFGPLRERP